MFFSHSKFDTFRCLTGRMTVVQTIVINSWETTADVTEYLKS